MRTRSRSNRYRDCPRVYTRPSRPRCPTAWVTDHATGPSQSSKYIDTYYQKFNNHATISLCSFILNAVVKAEMNARSCLSLKSCFSSTMHFNEKVFNFDVENATRLKFHIDAKLFFQKASQTITSKQNKTKRNRRLTECNDKLRSGFQTFKLSYFPKRL